MSSVSLYVFITLGRPDGESIHCAAELGRAPGLTLVCELSSLSLWAFLSSALWRVSGDMTCKDSRRKGEPQGLGVGYSRTGLLPVHPGPSKPELVKVGSRQGMPERHRRGWAVKEDAIPSLKVQNRFLQVEPSVYWTPSLGKINSRRASEVKYYVKARVWQIQV